MKVKLVTAAGLLVALIILFMVFFNPQPPGWYSLAPAEMEKWLAAGRELVIVDLREPDLFEQGHIPGAILLPYVAARRSLEGLDLDATVVFVCHNGPMGSTIAQLAVERGFKQVYNLEGGMADWKGAMAQGAGN